MQPTERFSSRVQDYVKYRPSYPAEMIEHLAAVGILKSDSVIADMGSGTGILSELLLRRGNAVFGVEPNAEMRAAGEEQLRAYPRFASVNGTAESTSLADGSVDLIVAAQAFHWFDVPRARAEFVRILKPGGTVALIWNDRTSESPFLQGYDKLLHDFATDYAKVDHKQITPEKLAGFFAPQPMAYVTFRNQQLLDLPALRGRLLSSSYAPEAGHPNHLPMLAELERLYSTYQVDNQVAFYYQTQLFTGRLSV